MGDQLQLRSTKIVSKCIPDCEVLALSSVQLGLNSFKIRVAASPR